jgi:hypothetical protein
MTRTWEWPSRERWAYSRQHPYWDSETGCPFADKFGHRLSNYATAEEIAALITAMKELWRDYGRKLREAKRAAGPLCQQSGERNWNFYRRCKAMSEADRELVSELDCLRRNRSDINCEILPYLQEDSFPRFQIYVPEAKELFAPFEQRRDAAFKAARAEWERECEQIPIDDTAWEQELQRRAAFDAPGSDERPV